IRLERNGTVMLLSLCYRGSVKWHLVRQHQPMSNISHFRSERIPGEGMENAWISTSPARISGKPWRAKGYLEKIGVSSFPNILSIQMHPWLLHNSQRVVPQPGTVQ